MCKPSIPTTDNLVCYVGYWSSGTRLADSARMTGEGLEAGDLPEYMVRIQLPNRSMH